GPLTRQRLILWITLIGIPLMTACGNVGKSVSSGSDPGVSPKSVDSTPVNSAPERVLQTAAGLAIRYANLQYTVTKAAVSGGSTGDSQGDSNGATAVIVFAVANTLSDDVHIRGALWQLSLTDGTTSKQPYSDDIVARDTKERKISFSVPIDAKLEGARLVL